VFSTIITNVIIIIGTITIILISIKLAQREVRR